MAKLITSFFTNNGAPATGLTPTITIKELTASTSTTVVNNAAMVEDGNGWYKYNFVAYDKSKNYTITANGGNSLPINERYSVATNDSHIEDIADQIWDENATDHLTSGSMGAYQNEVRADVQQLRLDVTEVLTGVVGLTNSVSSLTSDVAQLTLDVADIAPLLEVLLKFHQNRTKIDKTAKTLTVYDNDGTTPIKVFQLKDSTGVASVAEVTERVPQ